MSSTEHGGGIYSRQNFLSIYVPAMTLAVGTGIVVPAIPVYAKSFGVSFEVASLVIIVHQLGVALSSYPVGLLIDRIGRRKILLTGPVLLAISGFLITIAQSFPELLVYRFIGGVGEQMWQISRLAMIADTGADRERGRQITTMNAMQNAGRLFSPALGGLLAGFWDIRAPFIAHALLSLMAIIPSFKLVQETAPHLAKGAGRERTQTDATPAASFRTLLTYQVVIFFVAQFFASLTRAPIFSGQLNLYGAYVYNLSPQTIGILATSVTAIAIPITIAAGYIMDRYGRKATLVPGFSLLAVALAFLSFTDYAGSSFGMFVLAYVCVYTSNGITGGNMQTLGSDIAPEKARGKFYGIWQTIGTIGAPGSTSMFAVLSGSLGYWSAFVFLGMMAGCTALILGTQVRERWREKPATTVTS
ncbi:MAG: MFS transporter [Deltaproteobacteria bacterium]|nr:MFS transporter [Deltaproteobacteria bacterium]